MRIKRIALFFIALLLALPTYMPVARAAQDMPYRIEVDLVNQIVTVFTNDGNDDIVNISAGIIDEKKMRSNIERILK